jgi:hypothetical protein
MGAPLVFSSARLSALARIFWKTPYLLLSTKEVRSGEVDGLVSAIVHDRRDIKAEPVTSLNWWLIPAHACDELRKILINLFRRSLIEGLSFVTIEKKA